MLRVGLARGPCRWADPALCVPTRTQIRAGRYRGPLPRSGPVGDGGAGSTRAAEAKGPFRESKARDAARGIFDTVTKLVSPGQSAGSPRDGATPTAEGPEAPESLYKVHIADRYGMPAELPRDAPTTFAKIEAQCPQRLREQLCELKKRKYWMELTSVQQAVIPIALEHRDLLCVAPTATGKTLSYVLPSMMRLLLDRSEAGGGEVGENVSRSDIERLVREKMARGEICRYCELAIADHRVCPMTGALHPPITDSEEARRRAIRVDELTTVTEPQLLILVPTSPLALQVFHVCRALSGDLKIGCLRRASSAEEQQTFLRSLEGSDVVISAPETILPALYKRKLSLRRVKVVVLDEIDSLVSVNHFEPLKIVLGALPKRHQRPQRLLFGATLPSAAYKMIKEHMLLPSHRFVLADIATHEGHPATTGTLSSAPVPALAAAAAGGVSTVCVAHTHLILLVSRAGKMNKVLELYHTGKLRSDQRTIIFCQTRHNVNYVREQLAQAIPELKVTSLTSRTAATDRDAVMRMFHSGVSTCLVTTDILSRGIDFHNVVYVVNFDMPFDMETWVHRCGRCGRHRMPGYCYSLFQPTDARLAKPLVAHLRQHKQVIPHKLQEYAKQSFIDVFTSSLFHHPTRSRSRSAPEDQHPVMGRATARYPDFEQEQINKRFRPL